MKKPVNKWSDAERRAFQDGMRLRAQTIPDKKKRNNKRECRIPVNHDFD